MPTYQNSNFLLNITYVTTQPGAGALYTDGNSRQWYFLTVSGSGATAVYGVTGSSIAPKVGTLTKVSGTGDSTVTLNSVTVATVQTVGDVRIEAGQVIQTLEWIPTALLPTSVAQTLTTPFMDNIISSSTFTSSTTVTVPQTVIDSSTGLPIPLTGNYKIKVYVFSGTGTPTLQLNGQSAGVIRYLGLNETFEVQCRNRTVNSIYVGIGGTNGVNVSIEKI